MRFGKLSALAAMTAAALLASITPALAQGNDAPKAISPEIVALMATQDQLHKIAGKIERGGTAGFSGFYVDAGSKTLNVYWKGKAPARVQAEAVVAKAQGLDVKVHQAKYSQAELRAVAAQVAKNPSVAGVAAKYDGSGLAVKQNAGISARSGIEASVPLDVETGGAELATRLNDEAPYKGGGYIENWDTAAARGSCSSGFAVVHNTTSAEKLLTAAHCGERGSWMYGGDRFQIGEVDSRSVSSDSGTIRAFSTQARVWIGDSIHNEQNQFGLDVVGSASTFAGDWLCDSGAFSGTICEIRAVATGISVNFEGFGTVNNLVEAVHQGGYSAGGNGDSGGPIFGVQPGDKLVARGTLTAISTVPTDLKPCSGVPADPRPGGRKCSQRIFFPDITAQMADLDVRIKTIS